MGERKRGTEKERDREREREKKNLHKSTSIAAELSKTHISKMNGWVEREKQRKKEFFFAETNEKHMFFLVVKRKPRKKFLVIENGVHEIEIGILQTLGFPIILISTIEMLIF